MEENKIEKDIKQIEKFNYDFLNATRLKLDFPVNMNISDDTHDAIMDILTDYKRLKEEFKQIDHECFRLERKEIKLEKENAQLKEDIKEMYYKEAVITIMCDNFNLSRNEALELLGMRNNE